MEFALGSEVTVAASDDWALHAGHDDVAIVPIPALVVLLTEKETGKGAPLTRREVESVRNHARWMVLPRSVAHALEKQRGYADVDFDNVWEEWSMRRKWFARRGRRNEASRFALEA